MQAPKKIIENEAKMDETIKNEKLEIMRNYLWNRAISDEQANVKINDFNRRWIAAGGLNSASIVNR